MYYLAFLFLIVIPLLIVLITALYALNKQFRRQAVENIERAQDNIVTELLSDINVMSMRLSHLIYTNNNEIIGYAAGADTNDPVQRHENEQKLTNAGNLALEPVKDIISVGFYMKSGKETYIKTHIDRSQEEIKAQDWYQKALEMPNAVCVGAYDTVSANDLYTGGKKDSLILVFALSPNVMTDRSQKLEMVTFYQMTGAGDVIKEYNADYLKGNNKLGITRITDAEGNVIFSTVEDMDFSGREYTCIKKPVQFGATEWYAESYIKSGILTEEFWQVAFMILAVAVLVFLLAGYYSGYFLKSIVNPITQIHDGLKQVEEGNLEVHISPQGQFEVRNMIHQFNAMVRRLKVLIEEYEERGRRAEKKPADYLAAMLKGEMLPQQAGSECPELFAEKYALIGMNAENYPLGKNDMDTAKRLVESFERNHRYASRCTLYLESATRFLILYRIAETDYEAGIAQLIRELQISAKKEFEVLLSACVGKSLYGYEEFEAEIERIRKKSQLHFLYGEEALIYLDKNEEESDRILALADTYKNLAEALYVADEKNMTEERDKLFDLFSRSERTEIEAHTYAAILAIGTRFDTDNNSFFDVFGKQYNYMEKIKRLEDTRSLRLWITNYFVWIMDYSATKLNVAETDVIIKAKRYMADHYEDADLSLSQVAEYVGLNEKYFTNRFTKETGETYSAYLTGMRIQKAKELLRTTNFKIYEISEMVGYHNVEHFTRMFKKLNEVSPAQYRKTM